MPDRLSKFPRRKNQFNESWLCRDGWSGALLQDKTASTILLNHGVHIHVMNVDGFEFLIHH